MGTSCNPTQYRTKVYTKGNSTVLGADDGGCKNCSKPNNAKYVSKACDLGTFFTTGTDTELAPYSGSKTLLVNEVPAKQYVKTIGLSGTIFEAGSDLELATCTEPTVGFYVATACIPADADHAAGPGADTEIKPCMPVQDGKWAKEACRIGDCQTAGADNVQEPYLAVVPKFKYVSDAASPGDAVVGGGNDVILGACSTPSSFEYIETSCGGLPTAPATLNVTLTTSESAVLNWATPAPNNGIISDYIVRYKESAKPLWLEEAHTHSPLATLNVTDLASNTAYSFEVAAVNENGRGPFSAAATGTTTGSTGPDAPTTLTVKRSWDTYVDLEWVPAGTGSSPSKWAVQFRPTQRWETESTAVFPEGGMDDYDLTGEWYDSRTGSYVVVGPTKDGYKGVALTYDAAKGTDLRVGDLLFYSTRTKITAGTSYAVQFMEAANKQSAGGHRIEVTSVDLLQFYKGSGVSLGVFVTNLTRANTGKHAGSSGVAGLPSVRAGFDWDALPSPLDSASIKPMGGDTKL